jgi:hypothetical protein
MMEEFIDLSDDELAAHLDNATFADIIEKSREWGIIREAMRRTADRHQKMLLDVPSANAAEVARLQMVVKMYSEDFLPQLLRNFRAIGEFAIEEAQARGIVDDLLERLNHLFKKEK